MWIGLKLALQDAGLYWNMRGDGGESPFGELLLESGESLLLESGAVLLLE